MLSFRPIRLKICYVWACARDLEQKSLSVRERLSKGLRKKGFADAPTTKKKKMLRNCKAHADTNTHFCHSLVSFLLWLFLCGLQTDKLIQTQKPRDKQLIIRATKNMPGCQDIMHIHMLRSKLQN
ncbi:hypothetical protein XENOCAPTIV_014740 [Xenoophorus captivus]|uniref:Uncharacterized protein n=1 Tax=Xenoophorus captivus TaxID=1517983 RepID=A0ABV0SFB9_9TELE